RIAPFSTSFRVGGEDRPMAFLSSMSGPLAGLASRRKIEHGEEPRVRGCDAWGGADHELGSGGGPRQATRGVDTQAWGRIQSDLVSRGSRSQGEHQLEPYPLLPVHQPDDGLVHPGHAAAGNEERAAGNVLMGDDRRQLLLVLVEIDSEPERAQ